MLHFAQIFMNLSPDKLVQRSTKKLSRSFTVLMYCTLATVGSYLVLDLFYSNKTQDFLIISINDSGLEFSPLSFINVVSGELWKPRIPARGCNGVVKDPQDGQGVLVYCSGLDPSKNLWKVSPQKKTVSVHESFSGLDRATVPRHAKIAVYEKMGLTFLNSGGPIVPGFEGANNAGVLIFNKEQSWFVPISDNQIGYVVYKMIVDAEEGKLWVMSNGLGLQMLVDRIDIRQKKIDFSYTMPTYGGYDMEISGSNLLLSHFRTEDGIDVSVLDKNTGSVVKRIAISVSKDQKLNALDMLIKEDNILISGSDGIHVFNRGTYESKGLIENNLGSQFTSLVEGRDHLYAIDSYDRVVKFTWDYPLDIQTLYEASGQGLANLMYVSFTQS